jgi:phosphatidylinositol glycan class B
MVQAAPGAGSAPSWSDRLVPHTGALLAAGLVLALLVTRTHGVYQVDEYFQVVEAASYLLGRTPFADLTWEFPARIRPFLQPALYAGLARAAGAVGVTDPFALLHVFRIATALAGWGALVVAYRAFAPGLRDARWRGLLAATLGLSYFVPFLAGRTSSETLSGALLLLALSLRHRPGGGAGRVFMAGLFLGLAFDVRYQVGLAAAGVVAHAVLWPGAGRSRWAVAPWLLAGALLAAGVGLLVDAWAYGAPVFTPWNYLRVNLLEGKASSFGTLPAIAYPVLLLAAFPPFGAFAVAGLALLWLRRPRHLLTWATIPFFLGHSLIAHKEIRFLFPLLLPALIGLVLLWDDADAGEGRTARFLAWTRQAFGHPITLGLNAVGLVAVCLLPSPDNLEMHRWFREQATAGLPVCAFTDPGRYHRTLAPFVRPDRAPSVTMVTDLAGLEGCRAASACPVLVLAKYPVAANVRASLDAAGPPIFTSLPRVAERLDVSGWLGRADMYLAWRLEPRGARAP